MDHTGTLSLDKERDGAPCMLRMGSGEDEFDESFCAGRAVPDRDHRFVVGEDIRAAFPPGAAAGFSFVLEGPDGTTPYIITITDSRPERPTTSRIPTASSKDSPRLESRSPP